MPGMHHLIKEIVECMDLENTQKRASVVLFGETNASKPGLLRAIVAVAGTLGQGAIAVNTVEQILSIVHALRHRGRTWWGDL